jgi:hypothetical protein
MGAGGGEKSQVRQHTTWTQDADGGRRWIYLETTGPTWRVRAVHRDPSGKIRDKEGYYRSRSEAMKDVDKLIARNGGPDAWNRRGPEFSGSRFS